MLGCVHLSIRTGEAGLVETAGGEPRLTKSGRARVLHVMRARPFKSASANFLFMQYVLSVPKLSCPSDESLAMICLSYDGET